MKKGYQAIAWIELVGAVLLLFSSTGVLINNLITGHFLNIGFPLIVVSQAVILFFGGLFLLQFDERGFIISFVAQATQLIFINSSTLTYLVVSPIAFFITVESSEGVGTNFFLSTFSLTQGESVPNFTLGLNLFAVGIILALLRPYELLKEYGRVPIKIKCKNCNDTLGFDVELAGKQITCEYCSEVNDIDSNL